ncbi:MAG: type IV secretory system conjugative DNA transfer family protein [Oceanicaulis sp.]
MDEFIEAMFEELRDWLRQAGRHVLAWMGFGDEPEPIERKAVRSVPVKPDKPDKGGGRIAKAVPWLCGGAAILILAVVLMPSGGGSGGGSDNPYAAYGVPDSAAAGGIGGIFKGLTLIALISGFVIGAALVGIIALWTYIEKNHGWTVLALFAALLVLIGDTSNNIGVSSSASFLAFFLGFAVGVAVISKLFITVEPKTQLSDIFGSSRWATLADLKSWGLLGKLDAGDGLFLGEEIETGTPIVYDGDMHALTVAPTRTGKGATAIIPNLLRSKGSILVIDPKGENARRTAARRKAGGQDVHIVDPWRASIEADRYGAGADAAMLARFNPLDALDPDDPDLATDAMMLADALVVSSEREPFWTDEAKAMIYGFILYVVTDPHEDGQRTLGRVREILCLPPATEFDDEGLAGTMDEIAMRMGMSDHPLVRASAYRLAQKDIKERSNVTSTAQSNTHFLDSPVIRDSLSRSDFSFGDLKRKSATVYLVLPLDRLPSFNRWLRLLITAAMIDLTRTPAKPDREPVRVILDEFAALEKLKSVETAFGTMAGLGVQLWVITQDFSQLMRLYGDKGWQTFVSNSGVFQYFGSRDYETAKYAENLTGLTTLKKRSVSMGWSKSSGAGGSSFSSNDGISIDDVQRPLAYADEMMTLHRDLQVLFVENRYPIVARKHWWFRQARWKALLEQVKPSLPKPRM